MELIPMFTERLVTDNPGVIVTAVPLPTPGSVSIKYSALVRSTAAGGVVGVNVQRKKGVLSVVLHKPLASLTRTYNLCNPSATEVKLLSNVIFVRVGAAVTGTSVAAPIPGSVSAKNSAFTMLGWAYAAIAEHSHTNTINRLLISFSIKDMN
jgi:hypothetical protein